MKIQNNPQSNSTLQNWDQPNWINTRGQLQDLRNPDALKPASVRESKQITDLGFGKWKD